MSSPSTRKHTQRLVAAVVVLSLIGALVAPLAFARIVQNTIDPVATLTRSGRQILVTGPIQATPGERVDLRVTVTQRSTGAVAEGGIHFIGTGNLGQWGLRAQTEGEATFEEGDAIAVAIARTTGQGKATDAHQWLVAITLAK